MKKQIFLILILCISTTASASEGGYFSMTPFIDNLPYGAPYCAGRGGYSCSDYFDQYDLEMPYNFYESLLSHHAFMFSHIPEHKLLLDIRKTDDSTDIFTIHLGFFGQSTTGNSKIKAGFYWIPGGPFHDLNVYLSSSYLKYGRFICLNHFKQPDEMGLEFDIPMKNISTEHYYCIEIYAYVKLHITPRELYCICDFDSDGAIDLADFRILANDWHKPQGCYAADTSGLINGVPDGCVDTYDLIYFAQNWLLRPVDFDSSGKVDLRDYSILASHWQKGGGTITDYTSYDGFPDNVTDWYDLDALTKQMRVKCGR